jgi:glucosamine-6-phosphate deaminase
MRVRVFPDATALARSLAGEVVQLIGGTRRPVLGLPAGRTPIPLYDELARQHRAGLVDFSDAAAFNLDEFLGLSARHPASYRAFMRRHFFDHVNFGRARVHAPRGEARDVAGECERYERAIQRAGGIDLQILGLGLKGHVGFNEPAPELIARTHRAMLTAGTRRSNAELFGNRAAAVPREAISVGMATILGARRVVLIATGAAKAPAVAATVDGPVTTQVPASLLQLHPDAEVWVDREAATRLRAVRAGASRRPRRSRRARNRASGAGATARACR